MKHGKHEAAGHQPGRSGSRKRLLLIFLSLLLIITATAGGTLAYLATDTNPVDNSFRSSQVSCEVTESFDGTAKSNVNVVNTGDTEAYIRVKLLSYRVNEAGQHIGGSASVPGFAPGSGWAAHGGYYYYTQPVRPGEQPASDLIGSINLTGSYTDPDGGKQVIEVMAEAVQAKGLAADGTKAVVKTWGIDPETLS